MEPGPAVGDGSGRNEEEHASARFIWLKKMKALTHPGTVAREGRLDVKATALLIGVMFSLPR